MKILLSLDRDPKAHSFRIAGSEYRMAPVKGYSLYLGLCHVLFLWLDRDGLSKFAPEEAAAIEGRYRERGFFLPVLRPRKKTSAELAAAWKRERALREELMALKYPRIVEEDRERRAYWRQRVEQGETPGGMGA